VLQKDKEVVSKEGEDIKMEGTRDEKKKEETLPPGFRFHPTDEELISYYLTNKISDSNFTGKAIAVVDLNKCEPWDLPGNVIYISHKTMFFPLFQHSHTSLFLLQTHLYQQILDLWKLYIYVLHFVQQFQCLSHI